MSVDQDSKQDVKWGSGYDGRGRNELGRALEKVRSRLRSESRYGSSGTRRGSFDVPYAREGTTYRSIPPPPSRLTRRHSRGPSLPNIVSGLFGGRRSPSDQLTFDHKTQPYFGLSNLSSYPVTYKGKVYPTAEHLFQSFKVCYLVSSTT